MIYAVSADCTDRSKQLRPQGHPDTAIRLVLEHVVGLHALLQREIVGDQHRRVEVALLDVIEELPDVALAVLLR